MKGQSNPVSQLDSILSRLNNTVKVEKRPQLLDFETAKQVVWRIYELELDRKNESVWFTPEQEEVLDNLIRYFIGDPTGPLSLHKGIFLFGAWGVGKDMMFRNLSTLCQVAQLDNMAFKVAGAKNLVQKVKEAKSTAPLNAFEGGHLLIEDMGEENGDVKVWGNDEKVMDALFTNRYIQFDRFGLKTHATSNAFISDLEKMYGTRLYDRFCHMFEGVHLPGDSKRG